MVEILPSALILASASLIAQGPLELRRPLIIRSELGVVSFLILCNYIRMIMSSAFEERYKAHRATVLFLQYSNLHLWDATSIFYYISKGSRFIRSLLVMLWCIFEKKCISRSLPSQLGTVSREGFEGLCCLPPFHFVIPFFCYSRLNNHMTFKAQAIGSRQSVVPHAKMLD